MDEHTIKVYTKDGIWLIGTVDDYPFWAKVCDEASGFGIDDGRVIKLHVGGKRRGQELFAYERGWDKYPKTPAQKGIRNAMLAFCAALPRQDEWRQTMRREQTFTVTEKGEVRHDH